MDQIQQILEKIKVLFLKMGFVETIITNSHRSETNYVLNELYCIPQYVKSLGFLIEYADSIEEAQKHFHCDGDSFPLTMGEDATLAGIKKEIRASIS